MCGVSPRDRRVASVTPSGSLGPPCALGHNPRRYGPAPASSPGSLTVRLAPAKSPLQWGPTRYHPGRLCATAIVGGWGPPPAPHVHEATACPPPEPTVSDTVENPVCPKQPLVTTAECPSMECQSIDRAIITNPAGGSARRSGQALELYWPWSPLLGNVVRAPHPPGSGPRVLVVRSGLRAVGGRPPARPRGDRVARIDRPRGDRSG